MRESGANPLFVQPLVCGHTPVSNEARDGAQTGCVTYAWLKTIDSAARRFRFGAWTLGFPHDASVSARCWSGRKKTRFGLRGRRAGCGIR